MPRLGVAARMRVNEGDAAGGGIVGIEDASGSIVDCGSNDGVGISGIFFFLDFCSRGTFRSFGQCVSDVTWGEEAAKSKTRRNVT